MLESIQDDDSSAPGAPTTPGFVMHVVAHSHWDREWYMPFQRHRARLVALLDSVQDLLDRDPSFTSFHLDGQTIILDDYLEIRPERAPDLERQARAGRLIVGPWYVQPDEFLVSGEALVRNLLRGILASRAYGGAARTGYLPDSFGHVSQMPQILRGFEIDNAIFGRGLPLLIETADGLQPGPLRSEVTWQAPDGSSVLGIMLATWYNNAAELPTGTDAAAARLRCIRDTVAPFASTRHLLLMNGMDHQPVQADLSTALADAAAALAPDLAVQDSILGYVAALRTALESSSLFTVIGELRGQGTDGRTTLANTASSRLYLKRLNHDAQIVLEHYAEPLATLANLCGAPYPYDLLRYSWARLLQNQPHDSICGCSTDEVHDDMLPRFRDSLEVSRLVAREAAAALAAAVVAECHTPAGSWPILLVNTLAWPRGGQFDVELDLARRACASPPGPISDARELADVDAADLRLWKHDGSLLPATIEDLGVVWDYELPPDRSRQPYYARRVRVRAVAPAVPGLGYELLYLSGAGESPDTAAGSETHDVRVGPDWLENEHLRVDVAPDGSLSLTDKSTGERYCGLNVYEDCGDVGDEYVYRAPARETILTTSGVPVRYVTAEATPVWGCLIIGQALAVPAHAEPPDPGRGERRSQETVTLDLVTAVRLSAGGHAVEIACRFDNQARDHRLRALFPSEVKTDLCSVDSAFDVVERPITPWSGWQSATDSQPQQAFVDLSDGRRGLLLANRGLPEYEVLRDDARTVTLTLLRSVGHVGDWGVFPTPDAQCLGQWSAEYALVPHAGSWATAARWAHEFVTPLHAVPGTHGPALSAPFRGRLPAGASFLRIHGGTLVLSAFKRAEERQGVVARFYNPASAPCRATLTSLLPLAGAYVISLEERRLRSVPVADGETIDLVVEAKAIVSVELEIAGQHD